MRKILAILTTIVILMTVVSASDYYVGTSAIEVGYPYEGLEFTVQCDGECEEQPADLEVCGERVDQDPSGPPWDFFVSIPSDSACEYGSHNPVLDLEDESVELDFVIGVDSKGMAGHYGKNLIVNVDPDATNFEMRAFQLSDNTWSDIDVNHDRGSYGDINLMVQNYDSGPFSSSDRYVYGGDGSGDRNLELGNRLNEGTPISSILDDRPGPFDGDSVTREALFSDVAQISVTYETVWGEDLNSISPVHESNDFIPHGEIIVAKSPEAYNEGGDEMSLPQENFFICREDATMSNGYGDNIPRIVTDGEQKYACNIQTGPMDDVVDPDNPSDTWVEIGQHESGLSHNASNDCIDNEESWYQEYYEGPDACDSIRGGAVIAEVEDPFGSGTIDGIVAEYQTEDGWNTDEVISSDSEDWFQNWRNEVENNYPDLTTCQELFGEGPCTENPYGTSEPWALYIPEREYFDQRFAAAGKPEGPVETEFVGSDGWQRGAQGLWDSENFYRPDGPHDYSSWEGDILEDQVYDDDDTSNHIDAWDVANAGQNNNLVDSSFESDEIGRDSIFRGGFAAECGEGETWQYDSEIENQWVCDGDISWDQVMQMPRTEDASVIGLKFMPTNKMTLEELEELRDWTYTFDSFPMATEGRESTFGELETLDAECWVGREGDRSDASSDEIISGSTSLSSNQISGIYGEVSHNEVYTCEWTVETSTGETFDSSGSKIEIHNENPLDGATDGNPSATIALEHSRELSGSTYRYDDLGEFESQHSGNLDKVS